MAIEHSILFSAKFFNEFWSRVKTTDGKKSCWPWIGGKDEYGYGRLTVKGHGNWRAHRVSLMLAIGKTIGSNMVVRHKCDNPLCCNPAHLEEGTQQQNIADREARGRGNHEKKFTNLRKWSDSRRK